MAWLISTLEIQLQDGELSGSLSEIIQDTFFFHSKKDIGLYVGINHWKYQQIPSKTLIYLL
jgi:hypothetical protein